MSDKKYTVDEAFSDSLEAALIDVEQGRARNSQRRIGPSSIGGCREKLRATLFEDWQEPEPEEPTWNAAAAIGTLLGEHAQDAYAERHNGQTEVRVTTKFPCGISISGNSDLVLPDENRVVDLKSKARTIDASKWGPSDNYLAQIAVYCVGLVQMDILKPGATATIAYLGRSGQDAKPWSVTLGWEEILEIFQDVDNRIQQVVDVQEEINAAKTEQEKNVLRDKLRDCSPAYALACACPCVDGAEWDPADLGPITQPEALEAIDHFEEAKALAKMWKENETRYKEQVRSLGEAGVGTTPDGRRVYFNSRGALYVSKKNKKENPSA